MAGKARKARSFTVVLYLEDLIEGWEEEIDCILQYPFAYCIHDKDSDEEHKDRKDHVHFVIRFPNTTTETVVKNLFAGLRKDGKPLKYVETVTNIRYIYNYLIHDTDNARKKGKHQYDPSERITGNEFEIGMFEQVSKVDRQKTLDVLIDLIEEKDIKDFWEYYLAVKDQKDLLMLELFEEKHNLLKNLVAGRYVHLERLKKEKQEQEEEELKKRNSVFNSTKR